jgi:predicted transcriptional regulator
MADKSQRIIINLAGDKRGFKLGNLMPKGLHVPGLSNDPEVSGKLFRQLLSEKKARILHCIKHDKPVSLYALAKALGRDFKAVRSDVRLLEAFGLIRLIREGGKEGSKRKKLRPVLASKRLDISMEI